MNYDALSQTRLRRKRLECIQMYQQEESTPVIKRMTEIEIAFLLVGYT